MKLRKILERFSDIWRLPEQYKKILDTNKLIERHIQSISEQVNELTVVHGDVHLTGESQIIVVGKVRGHDYVRMFTVRESNLVNLIELLKREEMGAKVGRFDVRPGLNFSVLYPNDRF